MDPRIVSGVEAARNAMNVALTMADLPRAAWEGFCVQGHVIFAQMQEPPNTVKLGRWPCRVCDADVACVEVRGRVVGPAPPSVPAIHLQAALAGYDTISGELDERTRELADLKRVVASYDLVANNLPPWIKVIVIQAGPLAYNGANAEAVREHLAREVAAKMPRLEIAQ